MTRPLPDIAVLKTLFRYDAEAGKLFWLPRTAAMFREGRQTARHKCARWNALYAGKEVKPRRKESGYLIVRISGRPINVHRLAFALHHGRWPEGEVDHIDGDRANIKAANLRDVTRLENMRNKRRYRNNSSGITGVAWSKKSQRWVAHIGLKGKAKHIGQFTTFCTAVKARTSAAKSLGYHANHGRAA